MTRDEGHFEMLTALAVAGQLTEGEFLELEQHAAQCLPCAQRRIELEAASRRLFLWNALRTKASSTPAGMRKRFLMRAMGAGVPLSQPTAEHRYANTFRFSAVAVALILILNAGWNRAFETNSTIARRFVSAPNASAPVPSRPVPSAADGNANSFLPVHPLGKKLHFSKRSMQIRSGPSFGSRPNEKRFFSLNRAFSPGTTTTMVTLNGIPAFAPAYFSSNYDWQKSQLSSVSAATLWRIDQKESKKRIFDFSAKLTPLLFPSYQPDFTSERSVPDLPIHGAYNPTRLR